KLTYDTQSFNHVHEIIQDVFKDVENVTPGTVGAYFGGCLSKTDFKGNPSCSAACAGSVPFELGTQGWEFCDKLTILYNSESGVSSLTTTNNPQDKREAYVFVSNNKDFDGFTQADIQQMKSYGIEKAKIVKYSQ